MTPAAAHRYYAELDWAVPHGPTLPVAASPEVEALARGLAYDPVAIYNHVHDNIDYVPSFGLKRTPVSTLVDRRGNDFDQAALLVALLRAGGHNARYVTGTMRMPTTPLGNWVGAQADPSVLGWLLAVAGIPIEWVGGAFRITRVWVRLTLDGADYDLDPAYKAYVRHPSIDVGALLDYDRDALLASVTDGATITDDSVQSLDDDALRQRLTTLSTGLAAALVEAHPNTDIRQLLAGSEIVAAPLTKLRSTLAFSTDVVAQWDEIPTTLRDTFRVELHGIDHTFFAGELANARLTITFTAGEKRPELRLNGALVGQGDPTTVGAHYPVTFTADHPLAGNDGMYADQLVERSVTSGADHVYALVMSTDFVGSAAGLRRANNRLSAALDAGLPAGAEAVVGESLNLIGLSWKRQKGLILDLQLRTRDVGKIYHHTFGFVRQTDGVVIDWFGSSQASVRRSLNVSDAEVASAALSGWVSGSTLEHAVIEQTYGADKPGLSSVKVLWLQNAAGGKVVFLNADNWDTLAPELIGYAPNKLASWEAALQEQGWILAPANGQLSLNQWTGNASIRYGTSGQNGYLISGGLFGGYASVPDDVDPYALADAYVDNPTTSTDYPTDYVDNPFSEDPVSLATGSFVVERTDLELAGTGPLGLTADRSYFSRAGGARTTLGYGWSSRLDVTLTHRSEGPATFATRTVRDAAAVLVYGHVANDIFGALVGSPYGQAGDVYNQDVLGQMVMVLGVKWLMDQVVDNAVDLHFGHDTFTFLRQPDGSFSAPPGSTMTLEQQPDGTFVGVERDGLRYVFGNDDRLASVTDLHGNSATYSYTGEHLTQVADGYGRTLTLTYDGDFLSILSDSTGRTVLYAHDAQGDLTEVIDATGHMWSYAYDEAHNLTSITDPEGAVRVINRYDDQGRVTSQDVVRQSGYATYDFLYTDSRNVEMGPDGRRTSYFFDALGRIERVVDALGGTTLTEYDGENHVVATVGPRGHRETRAYDDAHNLVLHDRGLERTTMAYDDANHLTDVDNALQDSTQLVWNALNQVVSSTNGVQRQTTYGYDDRGRLSGSTNAAAIDTEITYDAYGHLSSLSVGPGPGVTTTHDPVGNRLSLTDANQATTHFAHDAHGNVTLATDPDGKQTVTTYDGNGNPTLRTDRLGQQTATSYTASGKPHVVTYDDGTTVTRTWDMQDRLVTVTDPSGTIGYTYDLRDRLVSRTGVDGTTVRYDYDANDNVTAIHYPGDKAVRYTFDALDRVTAVSDWLGRDTVFEYDAAGRVVAQTNFDGTAVSYDYSGADELTGQTVSNGEGVVLAAYTLTLDGAGRRVAIQTTAPLPPVWASGSTSYAYDATERRLLTAGGATYTYDDAGQIDAQPSVRDYTFNARGQLVAVSGDVDLQYAYDGEGRRVSRTANGVETRYIHGANDTVLAETDAQGVITRDYIHGLGLLASVDPSGTRQTYHFDVGGNVVALTDAQQRVVNRYAYTPYGRLANRLERVPQPFTFAGRFGVMRDEGDLYYMRARTYDAAVGRFISEDPLGFDAGDSNLYGYAGGNPLSFVDPRGTSVASVVGAAIDQGMALLDKGKKLISLRQPPGSALGSVLKGLAIIASVVLGGAPSFLGIIADFFGFGSLFTKIQTVAKVIDVLNPDGGSPFGATDPIK
ncbi:MAG: RHS repeat-associated protein [Myxococcota bacterium]